MLADKDQRARRLDWCRMPGERGVGRAGVGVTRQSGRHLYQVGRRAAVTGPRPGRGLALLSGTTSVVAGSFYLVGKPSNFFRPDVE
jgi:hypothetical protein